MVSGLTWFGVYTFFKFWAPIVAALWAVFKGMSWIKDIREKDFVEVKTGIVDFNIKLDKLHISIEAQTNSFVNEMRELRSDFRAFYVPTMQKARPARARKAPAGLLRPEPSVIPEPGSGSGFGSGPEAEQ
jgi:hypothetical protein